MASYPWPENLPTPRSLATASGAPARLSSTPSWFREVVREKIMADKGGCMGDKGGKKDKEKNKQQQVKKQKQEAQRKQDKARPGNP